MKVLDDKTPYERERSERLRKQVVSEKLRYVPCPSCGEEQSLWIPPERPPSEFGRPMAWAFRCRDCGSLVTVAAADPVRAEPSGPYVFGDFDPFVHENLGHDPVVVTSRQHFRELLRERNLATPYGDD